MDVDVGRGVVTLQTPVLKPAKSFKVKPFQVDIIEILKIWEVIHSDSSAALPDPSENFAVAK